MRCLELAKAVCLAEHNTNAGFIMALAEKFYDFAQNGPAHPKGTGTRGKKA